MFGGGKSSGPGRRNLRERKVSQRMAVVDETSRQQAVQSRLDALEADNEGAEDALAAGSDDDEFVIAGQDDEEEEEEIAISGKRKKTRSSNKKSSGASSAAKRQTRAGITGGGGGMDKKGPRSFARLLEDAPPEATAAYLNAAVASSALPARKFCSVCGNASLYTCARCGSRYCTRRCFTVHTETRCLKMTL